MTASVPGSGDLEPMTRAGRDELQARIEELILKIPQLAAHYLIELRREGLPAAIKVSVEIDSAWCAACAMEREAYGQALREAVNACFKAKVEVKVCDPGALARSAGKAGHLIDRRSRG